MNNFLQNYKHVPLVLHPNKKNIPTTYLGVDDEGARVFNSIYDWAVSQDFFEFELTPSGGIKTAKGSLRFPAWRLFVETSYIHMYILIAEGMWHIAFSEKPARNPDTPAVIYPTQAFKKFEQVCEKHGVRLEDYAIENGEEVKETIPKAKIEVANKYFTGIYNTFEGVHHIDFHSSFMGGLKLTHPQFAPVVDELFEKRNELPIYKSVLNETYGMFQTYKHGMNYRFAHLAKDMVENNNQRIEAVAQKLIETDRVILLYNTDGIWYQGPIYHGEGEGESAGTWSNDVVDCQKFRMKSSGSYEYIDRDGFYHVVQRGKTKLDKLKPRANWEWGDIFRKDANSLTYDWKDGIVNAEGVRL